MLQDQIRTWGADQGMTQQEAVPPAKKDGTIVGARSMRAQELPTPEQEAASERDASASEAEAHDLRRRVATLERLGGVGTPASLRHTRGQRGGGGSMRHLEGEVRETTTRLHTNDAK